MKSVSTVVTSAERSGKEFWEVLGTLLHELLHAWQEAHGKSARGSYHNAQFRRKAAECGLIVNEKGEQKYEPNGPFMLLLQKHGVHVPSVSEPTPKPLGSSKLKLWLCQCDPPFRVRGARQGFAATCKHCGSDYVEADPHAESSTKRQRFNSKIEAQERTPPNGLLKDQRLQNRVHA